MWIAAGRIVLDFYGNDKVATKTRALKEVADELRRKFNVSVAEVADHDDLERCVLGVALVAGTEKGARAALKKTLEHLDQISVARVMVEDTDYFGYD